MTEQGVQMLFVMAIAGMVLVAVMAALASAMDTRSSEDDGTDDDYRKAVLDQSMVHSGVYSGDIICGLAPDRRQYVSDRIAAYRREAEAIDDPKWRKAHIRWVEYSEHQYKRSVEAWEQKQRVRALRLEDPIKPKHR